MDVRIGLLKRHARDVARRYRLELIAAGLPTSTHVYDLNEFILRRGKTDYLGLIHSFYLSLNEIDKKIFLSNVLEEDSHYEFWYVDQYCERKYAYMRRRVLELVFKYL